MEKWDLNAFVEHYGGMKVLQWVRNGAKKYEARQVRPSGSRQRDANKALSQGKPSLLERVAKRLGRG